MFLPGQETGILWTMWNGQEKEKEINEETKLKINNKHIKKIHKYIKILKMRLP